MTPQAAAELVAIKGAVKPKQEAAAKAALPDGAAIDVDLTVRIRGTVTKGHATPGSSGTTPAKVSLGGPGAVSELLRRLKVTPATLRKHLRAIAKNPDTASYAEAEANRELLAVFEEVAAEAAAKLPPVPWSTAGSAGAVRTDGISYEILTPKGAKQCAA